MFSISRVGLTAACMISISACASTPGARPHDMSEVQHEAAASSEEAAAASHTAEYEPGATQTVEKCGPGGRACWTSVQNPTEEHRHDAEKHRKMAADHRAAAQALRDAENRACAGLSDDDRDTSPFYHREDIASVKPHVVDVRIGSRQLTKKANGADIVFSAVPGLTAEWLQRIVDCHVARASAVGHDMPEMNYCPLVLKNVSAKVSSTGTGFVVAVTSDDPETAKEILRRADALVAGR